MASHYAKILSMSSQHRLKPTNFRPETDEFEPVKQAMDDQGREMDAFLRACLRWYRHDPESATETLAPHWPPSRPRGRPPRP